MDNFNIENALVSRAKLLVEIKEKQDKALALRQEIEKKIPQEILDELAKVDEQFSITPESEAVAVLESQITDEVIKLGKSVKAEGVGHAIYNSGRVSWDTKGLGGLMTVLPQLEKLRKVGSPYVTFR